jgi:hypothetical protein
MRCFDCSKEVQVNVKIQDSMTPRRDSSSQHRQYKAVKSDLIWLSIKHKMRWKGGGRPTDILPDIHYHLLQQWMSTHGVADVHSVRPSVFIRSKIDCLGRTFQTYNSSPRDSPVTAVSCLRLPQAIGLRAAFRTYFRIGGRCLMVQLPRKLFCREAAPIAFS